MIEFVVKDHLEGNLETPVFFEYPQNPPESFLVLNVENNPRENLLDSALIVVSSYGPTQIAAATLNSSVKPVLDSLAEISCISGSKRGGDYPAFDTANKKYRYQAVQTITYYEE